MDAMNIVLEQLHGISLDLPVSERSHYAEKVSAALEANGADSALLYKLYKELDKVNDVDFGKVPDSKGNVTRYVYYDHLLKCIEALNTFEGADTLPNITRMNKVHNILLNNRADFEFGYKRDLKLVTVTYETLVLQLNCLIDFCISDYTHYLQLSFNDRNNGKFNRQESVLIAQVDNLIKIFESGNWSLLMRAIRKGAAAETMEVVSEATFFNKAAFTTLAKGLSNTAKDVADAFVSKDPNAAGGHDYTAKLPNANDVAKAVQGAAKPFQVIAIIIALLFIIRGTMFCLGRLAGNIAMWARNQSALLKASIDAQRADGGKGVKAQQIVVNALDGIADVIDAKYKKAEAAAAKDIKASNQEGFNVKTVTADVNGVDFGF